MIKQQQTMILSPYMDIYNLVIPKDNLLRKINELIDFTFVYDELINNPKNHFLCRGYKFANLSIIRDRKEYSRREKDLIDVELIDDGAFAAAS